MGTHSPIATGELTHHGIRAKSPISEACSPLCGLVRSLVMGNQERVRKPAGLSSHEQKQIVRQGYDRLSHSYRADSTPDGYQDYAEWIGLLVDRLPDRASVLDMGCGCGLPATRLLAEQFDVTGVDFSQVQIERAKGLVPSARFLCCDVSEVAFPPGSYDAVVSFYAIIHMPLDEHPKLFANITRWLRPSGYFLATVGHDAWTGTDDAYLNVPGGKMAWSHADEATNLRWLKDVGLHVHWTRFAPEGDRGHTLVLAQKPPAKDS